MSVTTRTIPLAAFLAVVLSGLAAAEPPLGKLLTGAERDTLVATASGFILDDASSNQYRGIPCRLSPARLILLYVNDHGGGAGGKPLTYAELSKTVKKTLQDTDFVSVTLPEIKVLTRRPQPPVPWGVGKLAATRGNLGAATPGDPKHHLLIVREGVASDSHVVPHELLHIILPQLGNPRFAGDADKAVVTLHHQLTCRLEWGGCRQAEDDWQAPKNACAP